MEQQKAYEKLLRAIKDYNANNTEQIDLHNEVMQNMSKKNREEFAKIYEQQEQQNNQE